MTKRLFLCAFLLGLSGIASAIVFGGSNLGMFGYPDNTCTKPMPPRKPYAMTDQWQVDSYNRDVDRYNDELRTYQRCLRDYIEYATNDIKRIQEKAQEAIDEASRSSY